MIVWPGSSDELLVLRKLETCVGTFELRLQEAFVDLQKVLGLLQIDSFLLSEVRGRRPLQTLDLYSETVVLRVDKLFVEEVLHLD